MLRLSAFVLLVSAANAQTPDPRPAASYDPIAVGVVRSYTDQGTADPYWRVDYPSEITVDGVRWSVRRAQRFYRFNGAGWYRSESREIVRFDTAKANVIYRAVDGSDRSLYPCRLDVPLAPDGGICGDGIAYVKTADGELAFDDPAGFVNVLRAGIGRVRGSSDFGPDFDLVGAVIGGETVIEEPEAFPGSEIDPTPASRYVPMSVGDEWQYEQSRGTDDPGRPSYRRLRVTSETEIDGDAYLEFTVGSYVQGQEVWADAEEKTYARFDTLAAEVVRLDDASFSPFWGGACAFDEPTASLGGDDTVYCHDDVGGESTGEYVAVGGTTEGGAPSRAYVYAGIADYKCGSGSYMAGVGYIGYECSQPEIYGYERLIYARVRQPDGSLLEIGQQYAVADEAASVANALSLKVGPNPVTDRLTLRLTAPVGSVRVQAFDALGRVVWQRDCVADDAVVVLDVGDWAAGLYGIRAEADGKSASATVVKR